MSEFTNPKLLALALMLAGMTSGCEPLENVIKASGANDSIGQMKAQDAAYVTIIPSAPEPIVEPEPVVYVPPPEPKPLGCEPVSKWRYGLYDCEGRLFGSYE